MFFQLCMDVYSRLNFAIHSLFKLWCNNLYWDYSYESLHRMKKIQKAQGLCKYDAVLVWKCVKSETLYLSLHYLRWHGGGCLFSQQKYWSWSKFTGRIEIEGIWSKHNQNFKCHIKYSEVWVMKQFSGMNTFTRACHCRPIPIKKYMCWVK